MNDGSVGRPGQTFALTTVNPVTAATVQTSVNSVSRQSSTLRPRTRRYCRIFDSDRVDSALLAPKTAATRSGAKTNVPARNHARSGFHPRADKAGTPKSVATHSSKAGIPDRIAESTIPIRFGTNVDGFSLMAFLSMDALLRANLLSYRSGQTDASKSRTIPTNATFQTSERTKGTPNA